MTSIFIIMQMEIFLKHWSELMLCILKSRQITLHFLNLFFQPSTLSGSFRCTVVDMHISFLCVCCIYKCMYRFSVYSEFSNLVSPVTFKTSFLFTDLFTDKLFTALHHNNKCESVLIHELQIFFAKISPI